MGSETAEWRQTMSHKSYVENRTDCKTKRVRCWINGKKQSIALGRQSKRNADKFVTLLDEILEHHAMDATLPPTLIKQVQKLDDKIAVQLIELNLVSFSLAGTIEDFGKDFVDTHSKSLSSDAGRKLKNELTRLTGFFTGRQLSSITELDAQNYRQHLELKGNQRTEGEGLSPAQVNRSCGYASQIFQAAIKARLITENPFEEVEKGNLTNKEKFYFVSNQEFEQLIECVPRWQVRLALALGRYAGIRLPSEAVRLRWEDVHFGNGTEQDPGYMMIENVKTKHHPTVSEYRKVPIFPELLPYLQEAWQMSEDGAVWAIEGVEGFDKNRDNPTKPNLRRSVLRSRKKAGLTEWPDVLKNLRKTRQTELTNYFPQHVVCEWLGNSERVAEKHYLHVTNEHLAAGSTKNTVSKSGPKSGPQSGPATALIAPHSMSVDSQTLEKPSFPLIAPHAMSGVCSLVGDEGGEPLSLYALKQEVLSLIQKASGPQSGPFPSLDDVMVSVSAQWDELSDAEKVVIGLILNRETVGQGATPASAVSPPAN
jgi:integrase